MYIELLYVGDPALGRVHGWVYLNRVYCVYFGKYSLLHISD